MISQTKLLQKIGVIIQLDKTYLEGFITRHLEMLTYGDTVQLIRAGMNYNHEYLIFLARSFVYLASRELCQLFHHSSHASRGSLADTYMHLLYFIYFISSIS